VIVTAGAVREPVSKVYRKKYEKLPPLKGLPAKLLSLAELSDKHVGQA
jgi:hypothetical protein